MSRKRTITLVLLGLLVPYLLLGGLVCLRHIWWAPPRQAAAAYLEALARRDTAGIYLYSSLLGPHLAGMMAKSDMPADARKHMWAKDYARWKKEFDKGGGARDLLQRERRLVHGQVAVAPLELEEFKAEVQHGETSDLVSYNDVAGEVHHFYYRLEYPSPGTAPPVGILDNLRSGRRRRIRSVAIRVEVSRRPDLEAPRTWLLGWSWLDDLAPAFPFRHWLPAAEPEEAWMAEISFNTDKTTLEAF